MATCSECDDTGWVFQQRAGGEVTVRCSCSARAKRVRRARQRARSSPVPRRYRGLDPDSVALQGVRPYALRRVLAYRAGIDVRIAKGRGLWLWGPSGIGKTSAAALIAESAVDAGYLVSWTTALELTRSAADFLARAGEDPFVEVRDADLLVVDDLDFPSVTADWVMPRVGIELARRARRTERQLGLTSTIITTARPRNQLEPSWGWKVLAALQESCGPSVAVDPAYQPPAPDVEVVIRARRGRRRDAGQAAPAGSPHDLTPG